ncbi:MAG: FmdE, Molybdenum formylmethanofuran dehydrogenase operon [Methanosaeta sp. PtaB.Bin039]|nr:MAG: FmdE, Molybdenum formylmethanofuran dehydrogenase operon [Methanosaeta sp. PtaB.Bin039]OPY47749.1 MAG: FmdE, Molybdenum formylmethanofuran dehydrogenase operon [Methanosaeta sp. PtaU1.Bin028]HOT07727.1 FmdE family protein [Methanotrichaceae archaeon]HQF17417.1 FmdE family protein [Methanotrichaceae archaeon]HQI92175.1 FmdE family protein [Methanotrichaceae archaeon]
MDEDYRSAVRFHGHECPGLAMGYRVARYVKDRYQRAEDEELVAVVENNSCSVDAVQDMLGCTFGKGNLIFLDRGKQVFTFYPRSGRADKALRIYFKDDLLRDMGDLRSRFFGKTLSEAEEKEFEALKSRIVRSILSAPEQDVLSVSEVEMPEPEKARIYPSLKCQQCGEAFMEARGRTACGKVVCMDCFEKLDA